MPQKIEIVRTVSEMRAKARTLRGDHKAIAFVPTMGFLHEGHLSLMREGRKHGDVLVVSIFVNPTQFGPGEDLEAYPRNIDRDLGLLEEVETDIVFIPEPDDVYSPDFQTAVSLDNLANRLCGLSRPVHFRGVATVVAKLFNIVRPRAAVFGLKDYQQYVIIRQMVKDLGFDIRIIGAPTVREPDGLAMSSRNAYLNPAERESAPCLYRALTRAAQMAKKGVVDTGEIIGNCTEFIKRHAGTRVDYIAMVDPETLEDIPRIDGPVRMALAVKIGKTRLIDNMLITQ